MSEKNEVSNPKFTDGQFVKRVGDQFSTNIVQIHGEPIWSKESEGYRYGIRYRSPVHAKNEMSQSGGASFSWPESDFEEIDNPIDLLIIGKFERDKEKRKLESRIVTLVAELRYINFSLNLVNPISEESDGEDER